MHLRAAETVVESNCNIQFDNTIIRNSSCDEGYVLLVHCYDSKFKQILLSKLRIRLDCVSVNTADF